MTDVEMMRIERDVEDEDHRRWLKVGVVGDDGGE